jgi:RNA polymerase sigma factor (sigma-70 family)
MNHLTDEQQFEEFRKGKPEAFQYFFRKYNEGIHKHVLDLCGDERISKEVTQQVFKQLWEIKHSIKSSAHLALYPYLMARDLCIQYMRDEKPGFDTPKEPAYVEKQQEVMNQELDLAASHLLVAYDAAWKMLSPMRRVVLRLLYVDGHNTATVARMLGLSRQTVRNTKSQALAFLRGKLYDNDLLMPLLLTALLLYIDEGVK